MRVRISRVRVHRDHIDSVGDALNRHIAGSGPLFRVFPRSATSLGCDRLLTVVKDDTLRLTIFEKFSCQSGS